MKKSFVNFLIIWLVIMATFNVLVWTVPSGSVDRLSQPIFWISYCLVTVVLIIHLIISYKFINLEDSQKTFYNIPIIQVANYSLIASGIIGAVFMLVPVLPSYIGGILCCLIGCIYIVAGVKAKTASDEITRIDNRIITDTQFMDMAMIQIAECLNRASSKQMEDEITKVYDLLKYSDQMSCELLQDIESSINEELDQLRNGVMAGDLEMVQTQVNELIPLINKRNLQNKQFKKFN